MFQPRMHFQRFEFKYVLDAVQFKNIRRFLTRYMVADEFIRTTKNGFYEVVSLYFDSPRFFYHWSKIDGAKRRKKIRIRTYRADGAHTAPLFLEIKRKHDMVILKDRIELSADDCRNVQSGASLFADDGEDGAMRSLVEEFNWEKGLRHLSPKLLVAYNREPYVGRHNKNVRVTFDYAIRANRANDVLSRPRSHTDVSKDAVVMEVKFKGALPFYLKHVIRAHGLARVPYSKYCTALEASYSLPMLYLLGGKSQSDSLRLDKNNLLIH